MRQRLQENGQDRSIADSVELGITAVLVIVVAIALSQLFHTQLG